MRQIGFLQNFEVCDSMGQTQHADIFFVTDGEANGKIGTMEMMVFKVGKHDQHESEFLDPEQDAWYEEVILIPFPQNLGVAAPIGIILDVVNDLIRGSFGPCPIPSLPYISNDENTMSERDSLEAEYFNAMLAQGVELRVFNKAFQGPESNTDKG